MLNLPKINARLPKYKEELVAIGGINYSDDFRPGDVSDSYGISVHRWPYLSTRWKRNQVMKPGNTTEIYAWDNHFVRVTDGSLYYDDRPLTNVLPGSKQFAVVNSKLIVWPDQVYIDIKTGEIGNLNATTYAVGATITSTTVESKLKALIKKDVMPNSWGGDPTEWQPWVYSYGTDPKAIKWSKDTGWQLPTPANKGMWYQGYGYPKLEVGDIIIPSKSGDRYDWVHGKRGNKEPYSPDISRYNQAGYYGVISKFAGTISVHPHETRWEVYFDVYRTDSKAKLFSSVFEIHNAVKVTGTLAGYSDIEKAPIQSMDDNTNKLTFAADTIRIANEYALLDKDYPSESDYTVPNTGGSTKYKSFKATDILPAGAYLMVNGSDITVWDAKKREVVAKYHIRTESSSVSGTLIKTTTYPKTNLDLTISRDIPDMDFICERGNRLWGCSNKERTIYCSELGIPENWYTYGGVSTDSWAVAVGTEGKFTACCKLGHAVCFFKEKSMTKVLGDFPENFSSYDYSMEGVLEGCHKSLQVMDGILYYLGTHGVHGYNGGAAPWLISPNFGNKSFSAGVSGNDGDTYYLSCKEGDKKHLFLYETKEKLWVREDSLYALAFARVGRDLRMLIDDGSVVQVATQQDDPNVAWMATFKPMWETVTGRKTYSKLIVRAEIPRGSWCRVSIRRDGGRWDEIGRIVGRTNDAVPIRIPADRCDKLEIKLEGHGTAAILNIARYFRLGSDKG